MPTDTERLNWILENVSLPGLGDDARAALDEAMREGRPQCEFRHEDGQRCAYAVHKHTFHLATDGTLSGTWTGPETPEQGDQRG